MMDEDQEEEYGPPLTETEQLVNILRNSEPMYVGMNIRRQAADEIERLAQERDVWVRDGEIAWRKVVELSRVADTKGFNPIQPK